MLHLRILISQFLINTKFFSLSIGDVCDLQDTHILRQRGLKQNLKVMV